MPKNHLFFVLLITLAPTPSQCNQLIRDNSTQWTITLINKLANNTTPLPTEPHILQKFYLENPHIIKPQDNIQKEIYSFITTEHPNLTTLQQKFPYLLEKMLNEALKCLQPIPNFTHPNSTQHYPPINPQNTPYTNPDTKMISWNCGILNTALP
jgi:hypothetical protein